MAVVRATAVRALRALLGMVTSFPPGDSNIFLLYVFPALQVFCTCCVRARGGRGLLLLSVLLLLRPCCELHRLVLRRLWLVNTAVRADCLCVTPLTPHVPKLKHNDIR